METIALFGGSFDPPHIAHESVVKEALKIEGVKKVVIMPTFLNPFKSNFYAPASLRIQWLQRIFASYSKVEISDYEVSLKRKVSSIESVKHLLKKYAKIYLIIGADNLESLAKWENYHELKTLVTFVIAKRDAIDIEKSFLTIDVDEEISSTEFRKNIDKSKLSEICSEEILEFYKEKNAK